MKITEKKEPKITTEVKIIAEYTQEEIKELIKKDLKERGYILSKDVNFKTSWKYVFDDWGMNRAIVTTFNGVSVEIERSGE